jgi:hypothetical protein
MPTRNGAIAHIIPVDRADRKPDQSNLARRSGRRQSAAPAFFKESGLSSGTKRSRARPPGRENLEQVEYVHEPITVRIAVAAAEQYGDGVL